MFDLALNLPSFIHAPMAIAYSGGADSTALLMLCAEQFPGQVQAIHIHHGLQAAADDFAAHCEAFCQHLGVPLHIVHVKANNASGESPEDAARKARYGAIVEKITEINQNLADKWPESAMEYAQAAIKNIAIAQHADDQVETILLALSRGAGLPGLSGMPAVWQRGGLTFVRPLLHASAQDIRSWLAARGLQARAPGAAHLGQGWVEDPTNLDTQFARNRIRHSLLPALEKTFPQFRETFARSARHAAQANAFITSEAIKDIAVIGNPPMIAALQKLDIQRQTHALRHWLKSAHGVTPSAAQLAELVRQVAHCTHAGKQIHLKIASGTVTRQLGVLHYQTLL